MGRKRHTAEQIIRNLREAEVDAETLAASLLSAPSSLIAGQSFPVVCENPADVCAALG